MDILNIDDSSFTLRDVYDLTLKVYQERVQQGISFWATRHSFQEYNNEFTRNRAIVLVAIDRNNPTTLCGAAVLYIKFNHFKNKYAYFTNAVVSPHCQRMGIGTKLKMSRYEIAKQEGCAFIKCTTAVNAESSVNWHKKNGYKIVGKKYDINGYYSYIYRKQITKSILWNSDLWCYGVYLYSCTFLHIKQIIKYIIRKK